MARDLDLLRMVLGDERLNDLEEPLKTPLIPR